MFEAGSGGGDVVGSRSGGPAAARIEARGRVLFVVWWRISTLPKGRPTAVEAAASC
jgi:hypothetical protein